jgi:nucleoside-diphosphate-sugar epimerase
MKKINVIITGATGMIGESVLYKCLRHDSIDKILMINRWPLGTKHPKLTEIVNQDITNIGNDRALLAQYDACFFCIGISSIGKNEAEYTAGTYTLTLNFAKALADVNPNMTFCYISGAGTDSTEKGRVMWARVKGKTENELMKLPFKHVYNFRPAALIPFLPLRPSQTYYKMVKYIKWILKILRPIFPNYILKLEDFSAAMINSALSGYPKNILEPKDIKTLAAFNNL